MRRGRHYRHLCAARNDAGHRWVRIGIYRSGAVARRIQRQIETAKAYAFDRDGYRWGFRIVVELDGRSALWVRFEGKA